MEQWSQGNPSEPAPSHQNHLTQIGAPIPKGDVVQYVMRSVTDSVRFAMCHAIGNRPALWDLSREKCTSAMRRSLFQEVAEVVNQQFVLSPPFTMEEVEKHWKNLKDTYVKTRKKLTYDHEGCPIRPKWKFFDALSFLDESGGHSDFVLKKRVQMSPFQQQQYDMYAPAAKKDKIDEIPTDEYMEFCRSLYLPLKEIGFKDRVHWLKIQKTIRDTIHEAQMESLTKAPPDMQ